MIYGIGCDLCAVARMQKLLAGPHAGAFLRRVFGPAELAMLGLAPAEQPAATAAAQGQGGGTRTAERAAANFAAKEAFLKAAGTGLAAPFALCEIEAVRLPSGAPAYRLHGGSAAWLAAHGLTAHLSLSHDGGQAMAFCLLERTGTPATAATGTPGAV